MKTFYVAWVESDTVDQADQVMGERLGPDEDYGFDYTVDYTHPLPITLYIIGNDENDALEHMIFDSIESAESYANDEGGNIYSVAAYINPASPVRENP